MGMMILQGLLALFLPTGFLVLAGLLLKRVGWFQLAAIFVVFGVVLPFLSIVIAFTARTAQTDVQYNALLDVVENMHTAAYVVSGGGALVFMVSIWRTRRRSSG